MSRLSMIRPDEMKRLRDRAHECRALADIATNPQARAAYHKMADAYLALAGKPHLETPPLQSNSIARKIYRRIKQTMSLQEPLRSFVAEIRENATSPPSSSEREALLKRARLADTTSHLNDWVNSSGLRPPK
jgi:hypothetical protein